MLVRINAQDRSQYWDFPGSSMVKTLCFHCRGAWVQLLVRALTYMVKNLKKIFFNSKIKIKVLGWGNSDLKKNHDRLSECIDLTSVDLGQEFSHQKRIPVHLCHSHELQGLSWAVNTHHTSSRLSYFPSVSPSIRRKHDGREVMVWASASLTWACTLIQ